MRVQERALMAAGDFDALPDEKTFGDPWAGNKDGKSYIPESPRWNSHLWTDDEWATMRRRALAK